MWVLKSQPCYDTWKREHDNFIKLRKLAMEKRSGQYKFPNEEKFISWFEKQKKKVGFNSWGQPIQGVNSYSTTVGTLTSNHIPVNYKKITNVPDEFIHIVKTELELTFDLRHIVNFSIMRRMNDAWKRHKSRLNKKYIKVKDPAKLKATPPPFVPKEFWVEFVDMCNSDAFQVALDYIGERGSTMGITKEKRIKYLKDIVQREMLLHVGLGEYYETKKAYYFWLLEYIFKVGWILEYIVDLELCKDGSYKKQLEVAQVEDHAENKHLYHIRHSNMIKINQITNSNRFERRRLSEYCDLTPQDK
ncbi:hypothetical protein GIB67_035695 [Kingdonia uniflora]|uniref:Uncharacterized protein n=1 Tax=Kingdonia uniflora TaxID=39325 RepID=A0A7J7MIV8_9MAGN|nr:hypothetical protein GIB67_035695 [Kingdonia uniflora]